jgi:malonate transporter MadL subunit
LVRTGGHDRLIARTSAQNNRGADERMTITGVALLAACTLIGQWLGELLGLALGVKANVGGVGIAMLLLIATRLWLQRRGLLDAGIKFGVAFWGSLYIPIVVAMAAQQNVVAAAEGGPIVLIAGLVSVLVCFAAVALLGRIGGRGKTMDEIEAERAAVDPLPEDRA